MKECEQQELKFQSMIPAEKREKMDDVQLQAKCHELARKFRDEIRNLRSEMKEETPFGTFSRQQRGDTQQRREHQEHLEGRTVLNPADILPKFFNDPHVQAVEEDLIRVASNVEITPTPSQLKEFTNMILMRLCAKNGKREELWLKMKRSEFLTSKRSQLKVVKYSPTDENDEDQTNVFNLGDDLGLVRNNPNLSNFQLLNYSPILLLTV